MTATGNVDLNRPSEADTQTVKQIKVDPQTLADVTARALASDTARAILTLIEVGAGRACAVAQARFDAEDRLRDQAAATRDSDVVPGLLVAAELFERTDSLWEECKTELRGLASALGQPDLFDEMFAGLEHD